MAVRRAFIVSSDAVQIPIFGLRYFVSGPEDIFGRSYFYSISSTRFSAVLDPFTVPVSGPTPAIGNTRVPVIR